MPLIKTTAAALGALALAPAVAHAHHMDLGDRTLVRGHEGSDVKQLQRLLTSVGIRTRADGAYGRRTHHNVHVYERRYGIRLDGRVSRGQARGLYRRARRPIPEDFGDGPPSDARRTSSTSRRTQTAPAGFPVAGEVRWGDGFGDRGGGHRGVDLFADCGTPLVATADGRIAHVKRHDAAGLYVVLRTAGPDDIYMHMDDVEVEQGATVRQGQRIGTVGDTGNASGCHLHFERWTSPGWYRGGEPTDPGPALREAQRNGG